MKKFKNYLIRVYKVIFNIKDDIIETETEITPKGKNHLEEMESLNHFNVKHIKEIMDKTPVNPSVEKNHINLEFINNRKQINEYKGWYSRLVGYKKLQEPLKTLVREDLKFDRIEMNTEAIKMAQKDRDRFAEKDVDAKIRSNGLTKNKRSLMDILTEAKVKIEKDMVFEKEIDKK